MTGWQRDDSGQMSILFALTIFPIALIAGFAIDFQILTTNKSKAQNSLDSAVIAGTRAYQDGASESEARQTVRTYFSTLIDLSQFPLDCSEVLVTIDDTDVEASTTCVMDTFLSKVADINELEFTIDSAATYGIGKVDVSFVFDISGSMDGSRIADLKIAARDAVDTLLVEAPKEGHEDDIRLSMVAYNGALNAGAYFTDATGQSSDQSFNYYYNGRWYTYYYSTTCVFEREGSEAFSDAAPGSGQYIVAADVYRRDDCGDAEPLALTSSRQPLYDYITALQAAGNTAGHLGVAWGWYMISPNWSSVFPEASRPLAYAEPDSTKALVLMTDGAFNTVGDSDNGSSTWQARQLCDSAKAAGIVIYSVAFQAPTAGREVLDYCSSGNEYFFTPESGQQLQDAYQSIASSISDLRITL
jgi:Flp pilus assembly protein TadG